MPKKVATRGKMVKTSRWYDRYPELASQFENIRKLSPKKVDNILIGIKDIIKIYDPGLIERSVLNFEIRRRWYDKDPYTWLMINALEFANKTIITRVTEYLKVAYKNSAPKKRSGKTKQVKKKSINTRKKSKSRTK